MIKFCSSVNALLLCLMGMPVLMASLRSVSHPAWPVISSPTTALLAKHWVICREAVLVYAPTSTILPPLLFSSTYKIKPLFLVCYVPHLVWLALLKLAVSAAKITPTSMEIKAVFSQLIVRSVPIPTLLISSAILAKHPVFLVAATSSANHASIIHISIVNSVYQTVL